jgi:putative Ca2+/H+ antiporter (TMEM165/GDT1 family)
VHLLSVILGEAVSLALPIFWVKILDGLSFIGFGLWTLRGDTLDDEEELVKKSNFGPLMLVMVAFFLAELGDKTMQATITIASEQKRFVAVWLVRTVGMTLADGLAIAVGNAIGRNLPEKPIKYTDAAIFLLSGLYALWEAFQN